MKIMITGSAGFIGFHAAKEFPLRGTCARRHGMVDYTP